MKQTAIDFASKLHSAIFSNNLTVVKTIIRQLQALRIDIDTLLIQGVTPLLRSITCGHVTMVELLLKAGSDINSARKNGKDALDFAGEGTPIYQLLLLHIHLTAEISYIPGEDPLIQSIAREGNLKVIIEFLESIEDFRSPYYQRILELLYTSAVYDRDNIFIYLANNIIYSKISDLDKQPLEDIDLKLHIINNKLYSLNEQHRIFFEGTILLIKNNGDCMYNAILEGYRRLELDDYTLEQLREAVHNSIYLNQELYIKELEAQLIANIRDADLHGFSPSMQLRLSEYVSMYQTGIEEQNILEMMRQDRIVEQYISSILMNGNWGGNVELGVISRVLGVELIIHRADGLIVRINNSGNDYAPAIHLEYNGGHYNLILDYNAHEIIPPLEDVIISTEDIFITELLPDSEAEITLSNKVYNSNYSMEICCLFLLIVGISHYYNDGL